MHVFIKCCWLVDWKKYLCQYLIFASLRRNIITANHYELWIMNHYEYLCLPCLLQQHCLHLIWVCKMETCKTTSLRFRPRPGRPALRSSPAMPATSCSPSGTCLTWYAKAVRKTSLSELKMTHRAPRIALECYCFPDGRMDGRIDTMSENNDHVFGGTWWVKNYEL